MISAQSYTQQEKVVFTKGSTDILYNFSGELTAIVQLQCDQDISVQRLVILHQRLNKPQS